MAGKSRIAGITIEIGGDTTELTKSLKGVDSELKNTTEKLADVNKLLKLDPGNTDLLKQKQKALADAISETKDRLTKLKEAQKQVNEGTQEWDALQREIVETEKNLESLEQEYKDFGSIAQQQVKAVGEKMQTIGAGISQAGRTLSTYVTAPLVAAGTVGATKFAEVDKTMQLVNSTMENGEEQANLLSDAMANAAANSTYGMSDAANAMLNFARAGLDAEQAAATIAHAMNLAAGEGGDLDTVSAGLVATINGFHGSFNDAAHYADVFANACNNSALDVNSLSNAMSIAAPIFSAAGYNVNDAALYMGVMANNGIEANKAANSLKTGISRLVSPTDEAAKQLKELDFSITNTDGSMKDSLQIQKELHDKFMELSEAEQIAAASTIFGKNQMAPWLALINSAPEDVNALSEALKQENTTTEMAAAMMSGFGGSIEKLKSSIDVAATSLGEALAPVILKIAEYIQKAVDWFNSLDESQQQLVMKIGLVLAALGPVMMVLGPIISGIGTLMVLFPAVGAAIAAIAGPIGIAVAAVVVIVGILKSFGVTMDDVKFWVKSAWDAVRDTFEDMKKTIVKRVTEIKDKMSSLWQNIYNGIRNPVVGISTLITNIFNGIANTIQNKMNMVKNIVQTVVNTISRIFGGAKWEFPKIKLPHFKVSNGKTVMGVTLPRISVEWYKKAYDNPMLFTQPTVFNGRGFGDGGGSGELVYGRDQLMRDIAAASQGDITINVYASEGMDVNQLAVKIQNRLAQLQKQRVSVYA